jgi:hypothetical protein
VEKFLGNLLTKGIPGKSDRFPEVTTEESAT